MTPCSPLKYILEEHVACIFGVEEEAEQDTSVKAAYKQKIK
jgi:hypothetical protein